MMHACNLTGAGTRTHHLRQKAQATLRDSSRDVKEGFTPKRSRHSSGGHTNVRNIRQPGHRQGVGALRRRELSWRRFITFLLASLSVLRLPSASHRFRLRLPSRLGRRTARRRITIDWQPVPWCSPLITILPMLNEEPSCLIIVPLRFGKSIGSDAKGHTRQSILQFLHLVIRAQVRS